VEAPKQDEYGIVETFSRHLELSLLTMHPAQAFEAAQHATRAYVASHKFVDVGGKGSAGPQYRMLRADPASASSSRSPGKQR
jgi:hypothetical protein